MRRRIITPSILVWSCAALFYLYQFILRVSPSVMLDELMQHFAINATDAGMLAAFSMYFYALFQIPAGFITDLLGVRKVVIGSILFCILGTIIFISTPYFWVASVGRCFLGIGSAAAFLCVGKVSTLWFPPERRSTLLGMTMAIGTVGAWNGSSSLSYLVATIGWRESLLVVTGLGALILGLVYVFLADKLNDKFDAKAHNLDPRSPLTHEAFALIRSKVCWQYAVVAMGIYLSISVLADLWGVSFLMGAHNMTKAAAAQTASFIYIGLCAGSLCLTYLGDRYRCRDVIIATSLLGLLLMLYLVIYETQFSGPFLTPLFFGIGFCSGAEMICFSSALDHFDSRLSGTVTGFINCVVMLGGALIQQQTGLLLDYAWTGGVKDDGLRAYSTIEYRTALSLTLATVFISSLFAIWICLKKSETKNLTS
jgi:MFS family permease